MEGLTNYKSIKEELASHILSMIEDEVISDDNKDEWHFHCFNEDYYIIGYHQASEWLNKHDIDPFVAIAICQDYEKDNFGETSIYDNSETTVNMLAYIFGEELLCLISANTIDELRKELEGLV